jgi:hypothetical protein
VAIHAVPQRPGSLGDGGCLADETIDAIASDHPPRDADDKRQPFAQATPGGTGLATLLGVTLAEVLSGHHNHREVLSLVGIHLQGLGEAPASTGRLVGLECG